jgi:hypothetical protein
MKKSVSSGLALFLDDGIELCVSSMAAHITRIGVRATKNRTGVENACGPSLVSRSPKNLAFATSTRTIL